jgi:hypothetical protein
MRCQTGRLGISIEALGAGALKVTLQSLSKSAQRSGTSERIGSLLRTTRLWHASSDASQQPCGRDAMMGHRDVKTAMHYQHHELEIVRAALDFRPPRSESAAERKRITTPFATHRKTTTSASH